MLDYPRGIGWFSLVPSPPPPQVGFLAKQEYIYQVYSGTHTTATWTPIYYPNSTAVYDWSVTFTDDIANYPQGCFYYGAGGRLLASQVRGGRSCSRCTRLPCLKEIPPDVYLPIRFVSRNQQCHPFSN